MRIQKAAIRLLITIVSRVIACFVDRTRTAQTSFHGGGFAGVLRAKGLFVKNKKRKRNKREKGIGKKKRRDALFEGGTARERTESRFIKRVAASTTPSVARRRNRHACQRERKTKAFRPPRLSTIRIFRLLSEKLPSFFLFSLTTSLDYWRKRERKREKVFQKQIRIAISNSSALRFWLLVFPSRPSFRLVHSAALTISSKLLVGPWRATARHGRQKESQRRERERTAVSKRSGLVSFCSYRLFSSVSPTATLVLSVFSSYLAASRQTLLLFYPLCCTYILHPRLILFQFLKYVRLGKLGSYNIVFCRSN